MAEDESKLSGLGALIPEIAYDLVGRVPPGAGLILVIAAETGFGPERWAQATSAGIIAGWAAVLTGAGFAVGLALTAAGSLLEDCLWSDCRRLWEIDQADLHAIGRYLKIVYRSARNDELPDYDKKPEDVPIADYWTLYRLTQDLVKSDGATANALIQKLSGERAFFVNSTVALWVWLFIHYARWYCEPQHLASSRCPVSIALAPGIAVVFLTLLFLYAAHARFKRLIRRQLALVRVREAWDQRGQLARMHEIKLKRIGISKKP